MALSVDGAKRGHIEWDQQALRIDWLLFFMHRLVVFWLNSPFLEPMNTRTLRLHRYHVPRSAPTKYEPKLFSCAALLMTYHGQRNHRELPVIHHIPPITITHYNHRRALGAAPRQYRDALLSPMR